MYIEEFDMFFTRELATLNMEIAAYKTDEDLWVVKEGISNSGGNLALHLVGNLNHFVGAIMGKNGYVRQREKEFSDTGLTKAELLEMIDATVEMISEVLKELNDEDLQKTMPVEVMNRTWTYHSFLVQLIWHLGYHNGQVNYHRRLIGN